MEEREVFKVIVQCADCYQHYDAEKHTACPVCGSEEASDV